MFGSLSHLFPVPNASAANGPPKDVPPATPVHFPRCLPRVADDHDAAAAAAAAAATPAPGPLPAVLQSIIRPTEVSMRHLNALGVHLRPDAPLEEIIPDTTSVPNFEAWNTLTYDQARDVNEQTRRPLNNGNNSPGVQTYLDRRTELSTPNEAAFRSVRRMQPPPGQSQVRLGNSYEFFRNLEVFATHWDDTSAPEKPADPPQESSDDNATEEQDGDNETAASEDAKDDKPTPANPFFRTGTGTQMPPEYRLNILTAFLKLVAYDFGCNVSAPRTEPRLYVNSAPYSPPDPTSPASTSSLSKGRSSYFSSGCTFIFRTPTTREAARAGIVEGPLAAVSARHTTSFPPPPSPEGDDAAAGRDPSVDPDRESTIDLARELVAALLTAQHRAREGKTERRYGEGAWWATKPRWGGGSGGPIGREIDALSGPGAPPNTDEAVSSRAEGAGGCGPSPTSSSSSSSRGPPPPAGSASGSGAMMAVRSLPGGRLTASSLSSSSGQPPAAKKPRRNMAMYDNYRMVRPPSASWDKKARYAPVGRARGAAYDDVFVVSALFHHVSVLRVRVPDRLLEVLDGAPDGADVSDGDGDGDGEEVEMGTKKGSGRRGKRRSWGRVDVVRSPWYDLFRPEERVRAMQLVWAMMAWLMRRDDGEDGGREGAAAGREMKGAESGGGDVEMGGS